MEKMREEMQRELDLDAHEGWEEKEEEFHYAQAKKRSELRLENERDKPIDALVINFHKMFAGDDRRTSFEDEDEEDKEDDLEVELLDSATIFAKCTTDELEELQRDIDEQLALVETSKNIRNADVDRELMYWNMLQRVCLDEVTKMRFSGDVRTMYGLAAGVQDEVERMFSSKSLYELEDLEAEIKDKIKAAADGTVTGIDITYWESMSQQITLFKAKAYLHEFHETLLNKRLELLEARALLEEEEAAEEERERQGEGGDGSAGNSSARSEGDGDDAGVDDRAQDHNRNSNSNTDSAALEGHTNAGGDALTGQGKSKSKSKGRGRGKGKEREAGAAEGDAHRFELPLITGEQEIAAIKGSGARVVLPEQHEAELEAQRARVLEEREEQINAEQAANKASLGSADTFTEKDRQLVGLNRFQMNADQMYDMEAKKGIKGDEAKLKDAEVEVQGSGNQYWWHDKYRPRKPRYFNRVKTGFDWNKYNKTHYDKETPPPKVVQGYKFNMFYPDLIDRNDAPRYYLQDIPGEDDFCLIRFTAGPPYEDVAFKIVKKEWNYDAKHGFRCKFERGVLSLYFQFKRYFYRR